MPITADCVTRRLLALLLALFISSQVFAQKAPNTPAVWQDRGDVSALDLFDGPGGASHQPGMRFKFLKESAAGSSPKFEVEDENGVKWKVKLGQEVKSETAATRVVWAAGYFVDEDYFRPEIHIDGMKRLARGQQYVRNGDTVLNVRLERHRSGPDPMTWSWFENAFAGTREFNGLRVLMALINNWDLKEANNSIDVEHGESIYVVADLGATFGRTGNVFVRSKGIPKDYAGAPFIRKIHDNYVDLVMHSRPFIFSLITNFRKYRMRTKIENVAKHIPIDDARWVGNQLGGLSAAQIGDCFRAAGYSQTDVDLYTQTVMQRIAALKRL